MRPTTVGGAHDDVFALSLDEILLQLSQRDEGVLPVAALREAQRRREEITPRLIELIEAVTDEVCANGESDSSGAFFALYLLAEFQAREALPAVLRGISLPDSVPEEIFEGALGDDFGRILLALSDDPVELLDKFIADSSLDIFVRWNCATTLLMLVRDGLLTRESAVERLRSHLRLAIETRDWETANFLVCSLHAYAAREALDEIKEAFRLELVDEALIELAEFEESLRNPESHFRQELEDCRPSGIHDTVEELSGWWCFQGSARTSGEKPTGLTTRDAFDGFMDNFADFDLPEAPVTPYEPPTIRNTSPRVGRNDPCPCGSSKKYKKCCGRS